MRVEAEVWEVREGEVLILKYNNKLYKLIKPTESLTQVWGERITDTESKKVYSIYKILIRTKIINDIIQYLKDWRTADDIVEHIKTVYNKTDTASRYTMYAYLKYLKLKNLITTTIETTKNGKKKKLYKFVGDSK